MLLNEDCLVAMQKLIDDGVQVDSVVTDPPYHLQSIVDRFGKKGSAPAQHGTDGAFARASKGFMGKEWDGGDIAFCKETWELALKLLKPGGHLLAFSASRNYHRMAVAIEDAGFEIRDQLMWLYGSGFPKSLNIGKGVEAFNKTGKTDTVAFRKTRMGENYKPTGQKEYYKGRAFSAGDEVIDEDGAEQEINNEWKGWGTALKPAHEPIVMARKFIEGTNKNNREKYRTGGINIDGCRVGKEILEEQIAGRSNKIGTFERKDMITPKREGRFPANVMHDGLDEEWARFFYCPKTAKSERNQGLVEFDDKQYSHDGRKKSIENPYQRNKSISKNSHPTVKPVELMKYLCRLVTPKGGTVLDPFMGSGSTGMAAKDEGFDFIGIEREKEYFEISEQRIKTTAPLSEFFT